MSTLKEQALELAARVRAGLTARPDKNLGPAGEAMETLARVIHEAKEKGMFEGSSMLKCVDVLLSHSEEQHKALKCAVDFVDAFQAPGEWTKKKVKKVQDTLNAFKLQAVKARLHQFIPTRNQILQ